MKNYYVIAIICGFLGLGFLAGRAAADALPESSAHVTASLPEQPAPDLLTELGALKDAYLKLKGEKDKDVKLLLWAGLIAAGLKLGLSALNAAFKKPKKWLAWAALGAAVPIALLSHFAAGNGWFDSLVVAGGGPGAILLTEILKLIAKPKTAEATA